MGCYAILFDESKYPKTKKQKNQRLISLLINNGHEDLNILASVDL